MLDNGDWFEDKAVEVLAYLRGYDEDEVRVFADENEDEHDADVAADLAYLTSALRDAGREGAQGGHDE